MTVKRFCILSITITLLLFLPVPIGALCLPAQYGDTFLGEFPEKLRLLTDTPGKRILVIGGSGVAFNINSTLIEEEFPGYTAINFGMYAPLGTKLLLDLTLPHLKDKDIVILMPEQNETTLSMSFNAYYTWQALDGAFTHLAGVSPENYDNLLAAMPSFALEKWQYYLTKTYPVGEGVYQKSSFNKKGDIENEKVAANEMPTLYDPDVSVTYDEGLLTGEFTDYLNSYAKKAEKKGAAVYYHLSPVNRLAINDTNTTTDGSAPEAFYRALTEKLSFPVIGDPTKAPMDEEWFYDTNFHLNSSGKTVFTTELIRDLKAELLITSRTGIPQPQKPLPSQKTGTVITKETYARQTELQTITIPADVIRIENGAFTENPKLTEIRILSETPSRIQIGNGLLDGTEANIYVPSPALSAYRTDYRFSRYADRIFPMEEQGQ